MHAHEVLPRPPLIDVRPLLASLSVPVSNPVSNTQPQPQPQLLTVDVLLGGKPCTALLDTGCACSVVDEAWAQQSGLALKTLPTPLPYVSINNTSGHLTAVLPAALYLRGLSVGVQPKALDGLLSATGCHLVLGLDLMSKWDMQVQVARRVLTMTIAGRPHTIKLGDTARPAQLTNQPATPLAPLIPLITSKQATRLMRKGCLAALVVLRPTPGTVLAAAVEPPPGPESPPSSVLSPEVIEQLKEEYADIFEPFTGLPPDRGIPSLIELEPGFKPPNRRYFRHTREEEACITNTMLDLKAKGWIEEAQSPFSSPVLLVRKHDGTMRCVHDYRAVNAGTKPQRFPMPRIDELLDRIGRGTKVTASLDMSQAYHQVLLPECDRPKTAFVTANNQYQYLVMPFGLTNAPAVFQRLMNQVFSEAGLLNKVVLVYLDDILVLSPDAETHVKHLRMVFDVLRRNQFRLKWSKCALGQTSLKFLGHIVGDGKLSVDPEKTKVVQDWPRPTDVNGIRRFLGLANYFHRFIPWFSEIAAPLTSMTSKRVATTYPWHAWRPPEIAAFEAIKAALTGPSVMLHLPDLNGLFAVHADASDLGTGACLMQDGRPVAYASYKFSGAELNWSTTEKELFALVHACRQWRCYFEGSKVELLTDHKPLIHLRTQKDLSRKQARWLEFLSRFDFAFQYVKGQDNLADPLSRLPLAVLTRSRAANVSREGEGNVAQPPVTVFGTAETPTPTAAEPPHPTALPDSQQGTSDTQDTPMEDPTPQGRPKGVRTTRVTPADIEPPPSPDLLNAIRTSYWRDKRFADPTGPALQYLSHDAKSGLWKIGDQVVVPADPALRKRIISLHHDSPWAAHRGVAKTLELVSRHFYWSSMRRDVTSYVSTCDTCQRVKASNQAMAGMPQALSMPEAPWDGISMDLIVKLPKSKVGAEVYDSVLVIVDRLTKYAILVPTKEAIDATDFAKLFVRHVFPDHGLPRSVVSDRGPQFNNRFWAALCQCLQISQKLSTAYHPQTDGQTERMNRVIEEMLRAYTGNHRSDWASWLPLVQFAINNSRQESTHQTPFYLNYGRHPNTPVSREFPPVSNPAGKAFAEHMSDVIVEAKRHLRSAQDRMVANARKKRRDITYKVDDWVLLSTKNMRPKVAGGIKKLMPKYVGPFQVARLAGSVAVELILTDGYECLHNVFHVSLTKPYQPRDGYIPGRASPLPLRWENDEPVYEVEKILDHEGQEYFTDKPDLASVTGLERVTAYYIKWAGCDDSENTWEPAANADGCEESLRQYWWTQGKQLLLRHPSHDIVGDG